jgi:hypothetical protein
VSKNALNEVYLNPAQVLKKHSKCEFVHAVMKSGTKNVGEIQNGRQTRIYYSSPAYFESRLALNWFDYLT